MLTAFPITAKRKPGEDITVVVPIYSTEPGTVTAAAPGCTFPDGADVVIAGTREYRLDGQGGDYLAIPSVGQERTDCSIYIKVDLARLAAFSLGAVAAALTYVPIAESVRYDTARKYNWFFGLRVAASGRVIYLMQSATSASTEIIYMTGGDAVPVDGILRIVAVFGNGDPDLNVAVYRNSLANVSNLTRAATSGTMGGSEALILHSGIELATFARQLSNDDIDLLMSDTMPANPEIAYRGNHEIIEGSEKIWDSAGTNDLYRFTPTNFTNPSMSIRNVDATGDPVVPASSIRVTIPAGVASPVTLTLTRPRAGVPERATDEERIESTTGTITLEAEAACFGIGPDVSASSLTWPIIRRVAVFAESDDPVSLTSDDVRVTVPASVTPVDGLALVDVTILAPVSGVTLEATQGTATADCSVTATEAAPVPVPEIEPNDTLNLFPRWLHSEPHAIGLSAVLDFARAEWTETMLPSLLIYDVDNQTSEILDLVAEAFSIYGWNKAAGDDEKIAFLRNSLKIQRKIGTGYAVKQAIRLVCDDAKIEDIIITEGTGGHVFDGVYDFDGTILYDSHYHWARFDVTIETTDAAYFTDTIKASITSMINHYKPVSRWLESLVITEI